MKKLIVALAIVFPAAPLLAQTSLQVKADTVKVRKSELIIENKTRDTLGYLVNIGNGRTEFRKLKLKNLGDSAIAIVGQDTLTYRSGGGASGNSFQFQVGTSPGFPVAADSTFTSTELIQRNVKIWRNGSFQYRDRNIIVDSALGKITFRPALAQGDMVYIEGLSGVSLALGQTAQPVVSSRLLVDFGGDNVTTTYGDGNLLGTPVQSPDIFGRHWNNWSGMVGGGGFSDGSVSSNLITTTGTATGISLKLIGDSYGTYFTPGFTGSKGINHNGYGSSVHEYPQQATIDNMFLESSINPNGVILRIKGLNPTKSYSFKLWGVRITNDAETWVMETRLATETWVDAKTFNAVYNSSQTPDYNRAIVYTNITGKDSVDIHMRVGAGSYFAGISVLDITVTDYVVAVPGIQVIDMAGGLTNMGGSVSNNGSTAGSTISGNVTGAGHPKELVMKTRSYSFSQLFP